MCILRTWARFMRSFTREICLARDNDPIGMSAKQRRKGWAGGAGHLTSHRMRAHGRSRTGTERGEGDAVYVSGWVPVC
jgi:hypothetical protein